MRSFPRNRRGAGQGMANPDLPSTSAVNDRDQGLAVWKQVDQGQAKVFGSAWAPDPKCRGVQANAEWSVEVCLQAWLVGLPIGSQFPQFFTKFQMHDSQFVNCGYT